MKDQDQNPLIRDFFNADKVFLLSSKIREKYQEFKSDEFYSQIVSNLGNLGFMDRAKMIRDKLYEFLPKDFPTAVKILLESLDEVPIGPVPSQSNFMIIPQTFFISRYGINDVDLSLSALHQMTKRFSAEWDIRTFLEVDFEKTMSKLHDWCNDDCAYVRRLVSEGTRSRLPWSSRIERFQKDPYPVLELLEKLKNDPELYVRRSVANNINDIAKDNPRVAIDVIKKWINDGTCKYVVNHAARNFIKAGNEEILSALGFNKNNSLDVLNLTLGESRIKIGEKLKFSFEIKANEDCNLVVDYLIHYKKINSMSKKVFKLKKIFIQSGELVNIGRSITMRQATTRTLYPGKHRLEIQINGVIHAGIDFELA